MKELVAIHVGQTGVNLATPFWDTLCWEHGIDPTTGHSLPSATDEQAYGRSVMFDEAMSGRRIPRTVLVDLDCGPIDELCSGRIGALFRVGCHVTGKAGTGGIWAAGHYTEGPEIVEPTLDLLRAEVEAADRLHGFQLLHNLGGGTGGGFSSLLLSRLSDEYPATIFQTTSVMPSPQPQGPSEVYNAVLNSRPLTELVSQCLMVDNAGIMKRIGCTDLLAVNRVIADMTARTTAGMRFASDHHADLRKMTVSLTPFPRMHFYLCALAPIASDATIDATNYNCERLVRELYGPTASVLSSHPFGSDRTLGQLFMLRGPGAFRDIDIASYCRKHLPSRFVEWIADPIVSLYCNAPARCHATYSASSLVNCYSITYAWKCLSEQFAQLFRRKAFLSWYTSLGMDDMEFTEAESELNDITCEYQCLQGYDATVDEEEGEYTDEDY